MLPHPLTQTSPEVNNTHNPMYSWGTPEHILELAWLLH